MSKFKSIKFDVAKQVEEASRKAKEYRKNMISGKVVLPENMSFWFPKLKNSNGEKDSLLKLPKTMFKHLDYDFITDYLEKDFILPRDKDKFDYMNEYMEKLASDFAESKDLFMKNGVFSNKFNFSDCHVTDRSKMGEQLYAINYTAAMFGVPKTTEVVLREFISTNEKVKRIYHGMPLNTEFRVFYDYDKKEVLGVANYWHPDVMVNGLSDEDRKVYELEKNNIINNFNKNKEKVCNEVKKFMESVKGLEEKWSVDVMLSDKGEFWLIDMARMERSALINKMESVD